MQLKTPRHERYLHLLAQLRVHPLDPLILTDIDHLRKRKTPSCIDFSTIAKRLRQFPHYNHVGKQLVAWNPLTLSILFYIGLLLLVSDVKPCLFQSISAPSLPFTLQDVMVMFTLKTRLSSEAARWYAIYVMCTPVIAAGDDDGRSIRCPIFEGVSSQFVVWLMSFTSWISWKKPELAGLVNGTTRRPRRNQADERKQWNLHNIQLFGAIASHVSQPIQASLFVKAQQNGVAALQYLREHYGSQSTGDRAEATARLQKSFIDPRAKLSDNDVQRQFNEMSIAVNDIVAAGGSRPDERFLISLFENALPQAYSQIRQMLRYKEHKDFDLYYNDLLSQVKAEMRSSQGPPVGAFSTQVEVDPAHLQPYGKAMGVKGKGKAKGKAKGKGGRGGRAYYQYGGRGTSWDASYSNASSGSVCFNCGSTGHTRRDCPNNETTCVHCSSNHLSELCPKGPGGPLRDSLNPNAWRLLESQVGRKPTYSGGTSAYYTGGCAPEAIVKPTNQATREDEGCLPLNSPLTNTPQVQSAHFTHSQPLKKRRVSEEPSPSYQHQRAYLSTQLSDVDEFMQRLPTAFMTCGDEDGQYDAATRDREVKFPYIGGGYNTIAYVDTQASNFVVPSIDYLSHVTDRHPSVKVKTANGLTIADAVGELQFSIFDDEGRWHTFHLSNVMALSQCDRFLYSQGAMKRLGVIHRLDEGYILLPDGSKKTVSPDAYTIEISLSDSKTAPPKNPSAYTVRSFPLAVYRDDRVVSKPTDRGADHKSAIPQSLVWQRLGFPSKSIWVHSPAMLTDHGLPPQTHLRTDFSDLKLMESIARARARVIPFHLIRDAEEVPAPGAVIYLDFSGPTIESYPHKFRYGCGAIDAGSGWSRIVACHSPTKEVAKITLDLLLADLRALMGLTHLLKPQVIVTDQGTQFMSFYFRDFLSEMQSKHWPSVTYTPQQNPFIERLWGTIYSTARVLLMHADLGPAFYPFALQTANWIKNRLPSSTRGNLSPWFILTKRPASIAHLRSFGCLTRLTLPSARREGDRHFADRGLLGIYLGPSENSPGSIVYSPRHRKLYVSRQLICYEDVHPGVKGVDNAWAEIEQLSSTTPLPLGNGPDISPQPQLTNSIPSMIEHQQPQLRDASDDQQSSTQLDAVVPTTEEAPLRMSAAELSTPETLNESNVQPDGQAEVEMRTTDDRESGRITTTQPDDTRKRKYQNDPSEDPSSKSFRRVLPSRSTRYQGAYFTDPTCSDSTDSLLNAMHLYNVEVDRIGSLEADGYFAFDSAISGLNGAYVVTSTVDMGDIELPKGYNQALSSKESPYWREAIAKELNGLIELGTFLIMPVSELPNGANLMRCHMVFTVKRLLDGSIEKFKCRLVANGNTQRYGIDFKQVFSTVAKISTLRLALVIAAAREYNLSSIDIRQAYLQATLSEDLYMEMPPGMPSTDSEGRRLCVKLQKSLYGLKQAGREWHLLLSSELCKYGFKQSSIDTCLFTLNRDSSILWVVVWVDDCVIIDNDTNLRNEFIKHMGTVFPVEDKGELNWVLQVRVLRDLKRRAISLSQELYINDLVKRYAPLIDGLTRKFDSPFDSSVQLSPQMCPVVDSQEYNRMQQHRQDYMALVGAYLWLANVSRPDLGYIAGQLARAVSNPGYAHYKAALRVLIYLRDTANKPLILHPTANQPLRSFVDADWATQFSVSGGVLTYMSCPVHWFSRLQRSVSMSSTEAEYFATCVMVREVCYFRELLTEFGCMQVGPTEVRTDNRGVIDLSYDPVSFKKMKHILRAAEYTRDRVVKQIVTLKWIAGAQNIADLFTKSVSLDTFRTLSKLFHSVGSII